jgi:hypothetical protein
MIESNIEYNEFLGSDTDVVDVILSLRRIWRAASRTPTVRARSFGTEVPQDDVKSWKIDEDVLTV